MTLSDLGAIYFVLCRVIFDDETILCGLENLSDEDLRGLHERLQERRGLCEMVLAEMERATGKTLTKREE